MAALDFEHEGFEEARAIVGRRRRRILLPLAVVTIMLLALIATAIYDYRSMRTDALGLSEGVISNLQDRIESEVQGYLEPITGIIRLSRDLLTTDLASGIPIAQAEALGIGMLTYAPQLTAMFVGNDAGEFLMVRRFVEDGRSGLETKQIRRSASAPDGYTMRLTWRDSEGKLLSEEDLAWDRYDPRTRPWFQGADAQRGLFWTDVYPFFTDRAAGITAAVPAVGSDEKLLAVVGADVTLDNMSRFLSTRTIGETGLAVIIDDQGRLIAHPSAELLREKSDGEPRLTTVDDLDDPILQRSYDLYRIEHHGRRSFELDGQRYISSVSSLNHLLQRDWSVLVVLPEDDFVGFVVDNIRNKLLMGLAVIGLAALFAGLLIRQGLRADREALQVLEREKQLDTQAEVFTQLAAGGSALLDPRDPAALQSVTKAACRAARVRRISVWQLDETGAVLACLDSYDRETGGHTPGSRLLRDEHPELFDVLNQQQWVQTVDAGADPQLATLHHQYLAPLGCHALLHAPMVLGGRLIGALWLEDSARRSAWPEHSVAFARALASLLVIRGAPGGTAERPVAAVATEAPTAATAATGKVGHYPTLQAAFRQHDSDTSLGERRAAAFSARLARSAEASGGSRAEVIDRLAVMSLRLTDAHVMAEPADAQGDQTRVDLLLRELEAAAREHQIGYLKFLSDQVIASVDPNEKPDSAVLRLAEFSLHTKSICETLFSRQRATLAFRIGLDVGPAIGSLVGHEKPAFALWGDAVRTAGDMADSGLPGGIQVTESVYRHLRGRYLFQLRGHHYLEGVGEFPTYLLGGKL